MSEIQFEAPSQEDMKQVALSGVLTVLSIVSISSPVLSLQVLTEGESMSLLSPELLGSIAYFLPLVFLLSLASSFVAQIKPYTRLLDIAGLVFSTGAALVTLNAYFSASSFMDNLGISAVPGMEKVVHFSLAAGGYAVLLLAGLSFRCNTKTFRKKLEAKLGL